MTRKPLRKKLGVSSTPRDAASFQGTRVARSTVRLSSAARRAAGSTGTLALRATETRWSLTWEKIMCKRNKFVIRWGEFSEATSW